MVKNSIILLFFLIILTLVFPAQKAWANVSGASAVMAYNVPKSVVVDNRAELLREYLESYNSPLADYAEEFIKEADENDIDWKLVPAITGVESYFGQMIPPYSYNGWGYGVYGGRVRRFASWEDGIATVTRAIRTDYMDKWGAQNVYEIGAIYAADRKWANKVMHFYNELSALESRDFNSSLSISI